jgi:hypothetical protein
LNTVSANQRAAQVHVGPSWWHRHGYKARVAKLDLELPKLVIDSTTTKLTIGPGPSADRQWWNVDWSITHHLNGWNWVQAQGQTLFSRNELAVAFGLTEQPCSRASAWLVDQYGADAGEQGVFVRMGNHLNIPGPGTGHDGDTNISIYVDQAMQEAVKHLLSLKNQ